MSKDVRPGDFFSAFEMLERPVWIWKCLDQSIAWANRAALEYWRLENIADFGAREFGVSLPNGDALAAAGFKNTRPEITSGRLGICLADDRRSARCGFTFATIDAIGAIGDCIIVEVFDAGSTRGLPIHSGEAIAGLEEATYDWMWETDAELRYSYFSEKHGKATGIITADVIGKPRRAVFDGFLPDFEKAQSEKWKAHFADVEARRPFRGFRYARQRKSGKINYLRSSGSPLFDSDGAFLGYRGTVLDITEEVEHEHEKLAQYQHFADAFDAISDGIALYDADRRLIVCNDVYRYGFGTAISPHIVTGVALEELIRIDAVEGFYGQLSDDAEIESVVARQLALHCNPPSNSEFQTSDGRWVRLTSRQLKTGGIVIALTDFSDLKSREKELEISEERYRDVFDKSIQGICLHRDMVPLMCNQACADIFGYETPDEFIQLGSLSRVLPPNEAARLTNIGRSRLAGGPAPRALEHQGIRKDGARIWLENRSSLVNWEGGPAIQVSIVDITERKRSEAKLHEAIREAENANLAKSEFLANMSHELRTPLNAVIGFANMMSRGYIGEINDRQDSYLKDIVKSGDHLLGLINDVLDLSKVEAGQFELSESFVHIPEVVRECVHLLSESAVQSGLRIESEIRGQIPRYWADERVVKQMLLNLLSNAVKFTQKGGDVRLVASRDSDGGLDLTVRDSGIGMAPKDIPKALAVFGQLEGSMERRFEGTGLGLPLVHSLADMHGGQLYLRSELGVGTSASIWLPAERAEIGDIAASDKPDPDSDWQI